MDLAVPGGLRARVERAAQAMRGVRANRPTLVVCPAPLAVREPRVLKGLQDLVAQTGRLALTGLRVQQQPLVRQVSQRPTQPSLSAPPSL